MGKDSRRRAKKESRRRRRIAMACTRDDASLSPTSILDIPHDLIELILLHVRTPVCLFRTAATCKPLRCMVAGAGFLCRFRVLHGPRLLLGHYCVDAKKMEDGITRQNAEFFPLPPRRQANRLSLDFLPQPRPYSHSPERVLTDSHGGLLAFVQDNWYAVVCDPWTRQYREVHFPWGQEEDDLNSDYFCIGAFLLDDDDGDNGNGDDSNMSSFMVLCACLVRGKYDSITAQACVFSARQNRWLRPSVSTSHFHWSLDLWNTYKRILGRAGGSIFWFGSGSSLNGYVLALDQNAGEFSTFWLPVAPDVSIYSRGDQLYDKQTIRIVGGGGAEAVRIVRLVGGDLEVLTRAHGSCECTVERRVGLCQLANIEDRSDQSWRFVDTDTTPAALLALGAFSPSSTLFFSLDVETMELQRLDNTTTMLSAARVFPYEIPWPEAISACL